MNILRNARRLYVISLQQQSRNISSTAVFCVRGKWREPPTSEELNPSFEKVFKQDLETLSSEDYEENLEYLSDVTIESYQDEQLKALSELERTQQVAKFKRIEQKYYLPKGPKEINLMTWAMKNQLFYLHSSDPHTWTPESLSTAFPISPAGVKRLLNSKWKPEDDKAIEAHDTAVIGRWKKYTKGKLGSANLFSKVMQKRSEMTANMTLPATQGISEKEYDLLKDLNFTGERDLFDSQSEEAYRRKTQRYRKLKVSFRSIISNYENDLKEVEIKESSDATSYNELTTLGARSSSDTVKNVQQCTDLSALVTTSNFGNKKDFVQISTSADVAERKRYLKGTVRTKRRLTFSEYSKLKDKLTKS